MVDISNYFYIFRIMEIKSVIQALSALAQETRLSVFRLLVAAGPSGMAAGAIADRLQTPAATLSFHLSQLSAAGLIVSRRYGRSIVYRADYAAMQALLGYLTENCCAGVATLTTDDAPSSESHI